MFYKCRMKCGVYAFLFLSALFFCVSCGKNEISLEQALEAAGYVETDSAAAAYTGQADGEPETAAFSSGKDSGGAFGAYEEAEEETLIYVHVCGEVKSPGVYALPQGSRAAEAVKLAGGLTENACERAVNLAEILTDGMQLVIPDEAEALWKETAAAKSSENRGKVNLNTATVTELCTLNGIGESKAEAIIAYREEHGGFGNIEELLEVSGIGDSVFSRISDKVYIE